MIILHWAFRTFVLAASLDLQAEAFSLQTLLHISRITQSLGRNVLLRQNLPAVAEADTESQEFKNDGPMAWMKEFLDLAGVVPGQTIAYGPFTTGVVSETDRKSTEEAAKLREEATQNLQNIDMDERSRRMGASNVMTVLTTMYAVWATFLGDQGDFAGHMLRFGTVFPLFLAVGYRLSADTGL